MRGLVTEDLTAIIARGHAADQLLINETFNAVCEDILKLCAVRWLASDPGQSSQREDMHKEAQGINRIRAELQRRIDAGKKAQADIDRRDKRAREI